MKVSSVVALLAGLAVSVSADPLTYEQYHNVSVNFQHPVVDPTIGGSLILSGKVVPIGQALYTAGGRVDKTGFNYCGGSLISDRHVLSAAHCFDYINYVAIGSHYNAGAKDGVTIAVKKKTIHPKNNPDTMAYDFLLLELATPVNTTKYRPVTLANGSGKDIVDGKTSTVMGWGATLTSDSSDVLLKVDVPLVSPTACAKKLHVDSTMLCAGGVKDQDSCQGDSGGPLIVKAADGSDVLVGVVSWGDGCGMAGYPGVYARVPVAVDWLKSVAPGAKFTS